MALVEKLFDYKLRSGDTLSVPVMVTPVKSSGHTGAVSYSYVASFVTLVGETTPTDAVTITNCDATLTTSKYVTLAVTSIPAAATAVRFYKLDGGQYKLLEEIASPTLTMNDDGTHSLHESILVPSENTSGRPEWRALLFNHGKYLQRQELMDLQWICLRGIKELGDTLHKNGDVLVGVPPVLEDPSDPTCHSWVFEDTTIYLDGQSVVIPGDTVEITATGEHVVGVVITPTVVSDVTDTVIRNQDEGIDLAYAQPGAYRLTYDFQWGEDQSGQLDIQAFIDNVPKIVTITPESSISEIREARRTNDVSGSFVVRNFNVAVKEHPTVALRDTKYMLKVGAGKAYPMGYEVETLGQRDVVIDRALDTMFVNNGFASVGSTLGGYVIASNATSYDFAAGKAIKFSVGGGAEHTVTLTGVKTTAATVTAFEAAVRAIFNPTSAEDGYPNATSPKIITASSVSGHLKLQAKAGFDLHILAVASDAYTILGISVDDYPYDATEGGSYVFPIGDSYIKDLADVNYTTEVCIAKADAFPRTGLDTVYGAADNLNDCIDGNFDYIAYGASPDLWKSGNTVIWKEGSEPNDCFVKYSYNRTATQGLRTLTTASNETVVRGANDSLDYDVLDNADVVAIVSVGDTSGESDYSILPTLRKNSSNVSHALSELDWDGMSSRPGVGNTYYVTYTYWAHAPEGDFVSADSYGDDYASIEMSPDGLYNLRDCIDFRTTSVYNLTDNATFEYNYYLARQDILTIDQYANLALVKGNPAVLPPIPRDQPGKLTIARLYVSPYTYTPSEVIYQSVEPMRITQIGIGELKKRIERLEYWQAVNDLENQTKYSEAATGAQGMFTDAITGQNRIAMSYANPTSSATPLKHTAAIDSKLGEIRLPAIQSFKLLTLDKALCTNVVTHTGKEWVDVSTLGIGEDVGQKVAMAFTEEIYSESPRASYKLNCNPDNIWSHDSGKLTLTPESDLFFDSTQIPDLTVDYDNNMASLLDFVTEDQIGDVNWNAWNNTRRNRALSGHGYLIGQHQQVATGERFDGIVPDRQELDLGDRVVDLTTIPYMRTANEDGTPFVISVECHSLMANADHGCEIYGIPVNLTATGDSVAGDLDYYGSSNGVARTSGTTYTTVKTDSKGYFTAEFTMPSGVPTGTSLVKIRHASTDDVSEANSNFFGGGMRSVKQGTTLGMTSARIQTSTVTRTRWQTYAAWYWHDPIAQSFAVEEDYIPLCCVGVYFASKDADAPITCEIRKLTEGSPNKDIVASVTLWPSDITTSQDASEQTKFWFPEIVQYTKDGYSFALVTPSTEYEVWASKLGDTDIITDEIIQTQSHQGSLFKSPNGQAWTQLDTEDIKFKLYSANFTDSACTIEFENATLNNGTIAEVSMLVAKVEDYAGPGTNVHYSYSLDDGNIWKGCDTWETIDLGAAYTECKFKIYIEAVDMTTPEDILAPILAQRCYTLNAGNIGFVTLLHKLNANYIGNQTAFTNVDNYPDEVKIVVDVDASGLYGTGVTSITPYYCVYTREDSYDPRNNLDIWCPIKVPSTYTPVEIDTNFDEYEFHTQSDVVSIDDITFTDNTPAPNGPYVIEAANHGFQDGEIVLFTSITGTGGLPEALNYGSGVLWMINNADAEAGTFELIVPSTGADSVGVGAYTSGGDITLAPFDSARVRAYLETTDQSRTPKLKRVRGLFNKRAV